jgi:hypothetical protein
VALRDDGQGGAAEHELHERLVERLAYVLRVVLGEQFVAEFHDFETADREAFDFETGENGADELLGEGIGLEQDEGRLGIHGRRGRRRDPGWQAFCATGAGRESPHGFDRRGA